MSITITHVIFYLAMEQALIIDAKNLAGEAVAKATLPNRVPYGFHGAYIHNASLK